MIMLILSGIGSHIGGMEEGWTDVLLFYLGELEDHGWSSEAISFYLIYVLTGAIEFTTIMRPTCASCT